MVLADVPGPLPQDGGDGGEAPQLGGRQGGVQQPRLRPAPSQVLPPGHRGQGSAARHAEQRHKEVLLLELQMNLRKDFTITEKAEGYL